MANPQKNEDSTYPTVAPGQSNSAGSIMTREPSSSSLVMLDIILTVATPMMTLELESLKEDIIIGIEEKILPDVNPDYFCSVIQSVAEGIAFTLVRKSMSNKDIDSAVKFCTNFIVAGIRSV